MNHHATASHKKSECDRLPRLYLLFTTEITPAGQTYHAFVRLIVRGTAVVYARHP